MFSARSWPNIVATSLMLVFAACSEDQGPLPQQVQPSSASNLQATPVKILGERFQPLIHANYDDPDKNRLESTFEARLGGVALTGVTYVSDTTLTATVPAGLPPGLHDLEVQDPRGRRGVLAGAFTVLGISDGGAEAAPGDGPSDAKPTDAKPPDAKPLDGGGGVGVQQLLSDPFGDGTPFSFVFKYADKIYLGPSKGGSGALRANPDGSGATAISFSFAADTSGGNKSQNSAKPPYTAIGRPGCAANTLQCGPDNENGRGLFAAGAIGGTEWLVLAGARSAGDLDYVYMTTDTDTKLDLRYVDLSDVMGPQTKGSSSMHVLGNRVYLGFPDTGGKRPYLVALKATPPAPGLDVASANEAENLEADKMPKIGLSAPMSMIDAMAAFNNRIYLFNNGGCMRATVAQPASYATKASDWADCTPSNASYTGKTAVTTSKVQGLQPADKAFAGLAVYKGRLYAGRNTTAGPQLWACSPATTGESGQCDPGDWKLVAANTKGTAGLTQFESAANTRITLVAATAARLYVGFNSAGGLALFRTAAATPAVAADFTGNGGCKASLHPAGCAGIGGAGLGQATNTRIFAAVSASFSGSSYLYLTAGNGSAPVRVYRVKD